MEALSELLLLLSSHPSYILYVSWIKGSQITTAEYMDQLHMINFEQRWKKATKWKDPSVTTSKDNFSVVPEVDPLVWVCSEDDPENWHVHVGQCKFIFRSIDSGFLKGFSKHVDVPLSQRTFKRSDLPNTLFILETNTSFDHHMHGHKDEGAGNLIPMLLALKITSKIRAEERFAVYVVSSMWPGGDPKTGAMQEILFWQVSDCMNSLEVYFQMVEIYN
ncbi:hypothetical protein V8G54_010189 [Vigna mungo]|uniref:Uncharacterized protein n=1 Tax=Vigna mungo TaxID=3915 RepID=A0AAQ3S4M4_VIGMU